MIQKSMALSGKKRRDIFFIFCTEKSKICTKKDELMPIP